MPADAALLNEVPLFQQLDEEGKALLATAVDDVSFRAGQLVFSRGDPGGAIYIVGSGEVEIFVVDTTGEKIVFETARTGDFFGELSLLDGDPRSASARAITDTRAIRVDRNDLTLLFRARPDAALDVLTVMGRRLREADTLLRHRPSRSPNQAVEEKVTPIQRLADFLAAFSGTFSFLLVHAAWFAAWIVANVGILPGLHVFDPFPFGLLTMIVSLEAIFLSCMVLISQSRQAAKERIRSDAEYEANMRAGLEVTQLHVKVDELHDKLLARLAQLEGEGGGKGAPAPLTSRSG